MAHLFATRCDGIPGGFTARKRRYGRSVAASFLLLGFFCVSSAAAQPGSCTQSVPVTVALVDGRVVRGLRPAQFEVLVHGQPATVLSAAQDMTPKRILLLLDLSKQVNDAGWKVISTLVAYLVQNARPEDRFALLTFAGPKEQLDFSQPRPALASKLNAFPERRPGPAADNDLIFDSLVEGLKLFGASQFGDTILLFTHGQDQGSRTMPKQLQEAFVAHRVRLFVISTSVAPQFLYGSPDTTAPRGTQLPEQGPLPINRDLQNLTQENGGVLFSENTEAADQTYALTSSRIKELQQLAWHMYGQIVEPYRVVLETRFDRKPARLEVGLRGDLAKRLSERVVFLHSHSLAPCEPSPRP